MLLQNLYLVVNGIVFEIWHLRQIQTQLHYPQLSKLPQASMAESTWHTYRSACASFNQFRYLFRLPLTWPAPLDQVVHFIAYMSMQGQAQGSIRNTYLDCHTCIKFIVWRTLPNPLKSLKYRKEQQERLRN